MQFIVVFRVLGLLLMVFGLTFIPPWLVGLMMGDADLRPFEYSFFITTTLGLLIWLPLRKYRRELKLRDGLLIVVLFWVVLGVIGAFPIYFQPMLHINFIQAVFESVSGITTTGA
ncbi:potassium transporter TrkG, partial [Halothiobacillus sp.]|uniref:potassium transporter TrkG n=1 Tax=Halothiobacillus sp. TaxID=1891311 RepID=UPI003D1447DC